MVSFGKLRTVKLTRNDKRNAVIKGTSHWVLCRDFVA